MRKAVCLFLVSLVVVATAFSQVTDWRAYLGEPPNPDQKLQNEHREKGFKLIGMLVAADPKSLGSDIDEILKVFGDSEEARGQASSVLATVAMLRPDSTEVLKVAVPKLISQFEDSNRLVRENSIRAIVSFASSNS